MVRHPGELISVLRFQTLEPRELPTHRHWRQSWAPVWAPVSTQVFHQLTTYHCPCHSVPLHEAGIWSKTLTEVLPLPHTSFYSRITAKSPERHSLSSFSFSQHPDFPTLSPRSSPFLLLPCLTLGFIPRLWPNPSPVLDLPPTLAPGPLWTQLALLTVWLQLLPLWVWGTPSCIATQVGAILSSHFCWQSFFLCIRQSFSSSLLSCLLFFPPLLSLYSNDSAV